MKAIIFAADLRKIRKLDSLYVEFSKEVERLLKKHDDNYSIYLKLADFVMKEKERLFHVVDDEALKRLIEEGEKQEKKEPAKLHIA